MIDFKKYDPKGASNCIIRVFSKLTEKEPVEIENELIDLSKKLNHNEYSDIEVFEKYLKNIGFNKVTTEKNTLIKDLQLDKDDYCIFCWDKNEWYHLIAIKNNTVFDRKDDSLNLYPITIYKR